MAVELKLPRSARSECKSRVSASMAYIGAVLLWGVGISVVLLSSKWLSLLTVQRDAVESYSMKVRSAYAAPQEQESAASFLSIPIPSATVANTALATPTSVKIFQVDGPLLGPQGVMISDGGSVSSMNAEGLGETSCQASLVEFQFKDSFGKPFVEIMKRTELIWSVEGDYTPPACLETSNSVMMNLTVLSKGVQFDRLAIMYFGDSEIFRTSTAEPRQAGISWEYLKDMSHLMFYWKSPQKVIFDLPNQTNANLTGAYNVTLTATFFNAKQLVTAADVIIPVSARQGQNSSQPSVFSVPATNATTTVTNFPRNANKAIFSISSTGQGNEEFWWSNALQSDTLTYNASGGVIFGYSPFREVQLYVDGIMAGVQWPFPVIFTGGVVPAFWSPVVGIDAFDLKEYQIDITPWLPQLCDGQPHTFTMKVAGLNDDGKSNATLSDTVASNWQLTGKIFIWLDDEGKITTGTAPTVSISALNIAVSQAVTQNATGVNDTLTYSISVQRHLQISSSITTQTGTLAVSWTQVLNHTDQSAFMDFGNIQSNIIATNGMDAAIRGAVTDYTSTYSYPLFANSTGALFPNGTSTFVATLARTKNVAIRGISLYPSGLQPFAALPQSKDLVLTLAGTTYSNTQNGTATLFLVPGNTNASFSRGATDQSMRFGGKSAQGELGMEPDIELYFRAVKAVNGTLRSDVERLVGKGLVRGVDGADGNASGSADLIGAGMDALAGRRQQQQLDLIPQEVLT